MAWMLKLHMLIFGVSALTACGQTVHQTAVKGLVIDPGISKEAKAHIAAIADMDSLYQGMPMSVYSNAVWVKTYEADTLTFADTSFSNKQLFKSFYVWNGDTLVINGSFGLFGGIGFSIHVSKEGATLYHLVNADAYKTLGYRPNDTLTDILNVPCTQAKMVLSELPDSNQKQTIFGYAALESATYYHGTMADGKEQLPRSKQRMDMRIYFKSSFLKL